MKFNSHKVNETVGANLKQLRKNFGYRSASAFANAHNIAVQTYLNHESGKRGMDIATLLCYADFLGVHYTKIIGDVSVLIKLARLS